LRILFSLAGGDSVAAAAAAAAVHSPGSTSHQVTVNGIPFTQELRKVFALMLGKVISFPLSSHFQTTTSFILNPQKASFVFVYTPCSSKLYVDPSPALSALTTIDGKAGSGVVAVLEFAMVVIFALELKLIGGFVLQADM
jgi:hypothetical protein